MATITQEKNVTAEFVVKQAIEIYGKMKTANIHIMDVKQTEDFTKMIHKTYPDFCISYPIVARYICQLRQFDPSVFKKWLLEIQKNPWKTEEDYLDANARYINMLYKKSLKSTHPDQADIKNHYTEVRKVLQEEHESFKTKVKDLEEKVKNKESEFSVKNKEELYRYTKSLQNKLASEADQ